MANEKRLIMVDAHKLEELLSECLDVIKSIKPTQIPLLQSLLVWIGYCKKPTVDAVEVVHGKWKNSDFISGMLTCTNCGAQRNPKFKIGGGAWHYCPNCGAKMDGDGNA